MMIYFAAVVFSISMGATFGFSVGAVAFAGCFFLYELVSAK